MSDKKEIAENKSHHEKLMDKKYGDAENLKNQINSTKDAAEKQSMRSKAMIHMAALGWTKKQTAEYLGISPARVQAVLGTQSAKQQIFKLQEELFVRDPQKMFLQILPSAVKVAKTVMLSKKTTNSVKVDTAFRFMDRALGKPVQEIKHEGNAIRELFMALDRKNRGEDDVVKKDEPIDAEFKEVESEVKKDPLDNWLDENL